MTTELELIYTIWDIVTAGQSNADNPINERLMRQFLSIHRGKFLNQYFKKGDLIPDEVFQDLGPISFTQSGTEYVSGKMPKVIRLKNDQGISLNKDGYVISVLNSEEFINSKNNRYNKYHPRVKFINEILTLNIGEEQDCSVLDDHFNTMLNSTVRKLKSEAQTNSITISGQAVLVNTDDGLNYDMSSSVYPFPDELIESLINSVNAREFNIFLKVASDESGDARHNTSDFNTREEL